jgi:mycothiol system anti-sigma-R factor
VSCERTSFVLHAYFDGELDAADVPEFERHLESCPDCAAALAVQETLRSSLKGSKLRERAPESLRRKLAAEITEPIPRAATPSSSTTKWRALALAASFLLVVAIGWRYLEGPNGTGDDATLFPSIVDAHLRSLQPGHLIDVVSTDQHTVKPWFDGKIDFAPPVRDLAPDGFPLEGGRLDAISGRTVAVVVYARRKHVINVFVWPTTKQDAAPTSGSRLGYNWVEWRKDGMETIAVSDVSAADLNALWQLLTK